MNFTAVPGKHNWIYLRNHMPEGSVPADARFVRLAYTGKIPAGMKLLCVLQEEGGVSCSYELPLPEEAAGGGELIVPLAQVPADRLECRVSGRHSDRRPDSLGTYRADRNSG